MPRPSAGLRARVVPGKPFEQPVSGWRNGRASRRRNPPTITRQSHQATAYFETSIMDLGSARLARPAADFRLVPAWKAPIAQPSGKRRKGLYGGTYKPSVCCDP